MAGIGAREAASPESIGTTMTSISVTSSEPRMCSGNEASSPDDPPSKPAEIVEDYKVRGLDKRGRKVLDILWKTKDFVIFQHAGGISPHFADNDDLSRKQADRYIRLGPALSRINALLPPPEKTGDSVRRRWSFFQTPDAFLYRETARAIANALTDNHERAVDILAFT